MLFLAFSTLFLARRTSGRFDPISGRFISDWIPIHLPVRILLVNTAILLLSCLTIEIARRAAALETILVPATTLPGIRRIPERSIAWVRLTSVLGLMFLLSQALAWSALHASGYFLNTGPASSFVFLVTGAHAVHLVGGVIALLYASFSPNLRRSLESRRITIDVTAWYWHFMGLLWLYLLTMIWLIR
jgi:cytochrome c oxidase subunit 3